MALGFPNTLDEFRKKWEEELSKRSQAHSSKANCSTNDTASTSKELGNCGHKYDEVRTKRKTPSESIGSSVPEKLLRSDCDKKIEVNNANVKDQLPKAVASDGGPCDTQSKDKKLCFVDIFINDLNEIDPIPFFDIELPREVAINIFKHLSARDLCRCAQVSKSWQGLAEDELLWCRICHALGYEEQSTALEKDNWKEIVRNAVEMESLLVFNWKNRIGGLEELNYVPGGILTAVSSFEDWLVAGYTSMDVKLWDLSSDTSCILNPSSKALVLNNEGSFLNNYVTDIKVNKTHTFALYNSGLLNIWEIEGNHQKPIHASNQIQGKWLLRCSDKSPLVGIGNETIQLLTEKTDKDYTSSFMVENKSGLKNDEFEDPLEKGESWEQLPCLNYFQLLADVEGVSIHDFLIAAKSAASSFDSIDDHLVITAVNDVVLVHNLSQDISDPNHMTQLYHTVFAPVQMIDYKTTGKVALVISKGYNFYNYSRFMSGGPNEIQLYDIDTNKQIVTFGPTSENVKVINLKDSPENELVSGGYGIIHVYDQRIGETVLSLHDQVKLPLTQVQMDEWKIVSGSKSGYVSIWDRRMATKSWEMHNRHPVEYVHFRKNLMITANIPSDLSACFQDQAQPEFMLHKRYRGHLSVFDFSVSQQREALPSICQSTFDEPERYNYNIRLAMPYDNL